MGSYHIHTGATTATLSSTALTTPAGGHTLLADRPTFTAPFTVTDARSAVTFTVTNTTWTVTVDGTQSADAATRHPDLWVRAVRLAGHDVPLDRTRLGQVAGQLWLVAARTVPGPAADPAWALVCDALGFGPEDRFAPNARVSLLVADTVASQLTRDAAWLTRAAETLGVDPALADWLTPNGLVHELAARLPYQADALVELTADVAAPIVAALWRRGWNDDTLPPAAGGCRTNDQFAGA